MPLFVRVPDLDKDFDVAGMSRENDGLTGVASEVNNLHRICTEVCLASVCVWMRWTMARSEFVLFLGVLLPV